MLLRKCSVALTTVNNSISLVEYFFSAVLSYLDANDSQCHPFEPYCSSTGPKPSLLCEFPRYNSKCLNSTIFSTNYFRCWRALASRLFHCLGLITVGVEKYLLLNSVNNYVGCARIPLGTSTSTVFKTLRDFLNV